MIGNARLKVTQEFDPSAGSFFGKIVLEGKKLKSIFLLLIISFLLLYLFTRNFQLEFFGIWNLELWEFNTIHIIQEVNSVQGGLFGWRVPRKQ